MASTQTHPAFPSSRPYSNTLHGKLPERNAPFGTSINPSNRETARLERERQERERQAPAGGLPNPVNALSDEQREEINEAFGLFDLDKDQRIDYHEFKVSLKALGFDLPKPEILSLLTTHGIPPDTPALPNTQGQNAPQTQNQPQPSSSRHPQSQSQSQNANQNSAQYPPGRLQLTLPAFQLIAATLIGNRDPRDEVLRAFALFDTEDKGMISLEDLRRVARELGEGLDEEELVAMIEEFDLDNKGGVGREEFVQICMG